MDSERNQNLNIPIRDYVDTQIKWLDTIFRMQIETITKNTALASLQIDKRLESMNEFRDTLRDQAGRLATRSELETSNQALNERIKMLELSKANTDGKTLVICTLISFVMSLIVVGITIYFTRH